MVGLVYTYNNQRKVIVINCKVKIGIYLFDECPYKRLRYYSLEAYLDIKTNVMESHQIIFKTKKDDIEEMLQEGIMEIYFSNYLLSFDI